LGKNCNVLNHQGEDHHPLDPHPHPHPHYIVTAEEQVGEISSQKLVAFEKKYLQSLIDTHHWLAQLLVVLGEQFVGFLQLPTFLHKQPITFSL